MARETIPAAYRERLVNRLTNKYTVQAFNPDANKAADAGAFLEGTYFALTVVGFSDDVIGSIQADALKEAGLDESDNGAEPAETIPAPTAKSGK